MFQKFIKSIWLAICVSSNVVYANDIINSEDTVKPIITSVDILDSHKDPSVIVDNTENLVAEPLEITDYKTLAISGDKASIDKILSSNQINQKINGTYLVIVAAQKFNTETFNRVIESKPNLGSTNQNGENALFWALSRNAPNFAASIQKENPKEYNQQLLKKNNDGRYPIHNMALFSNSIDVAKLSISDKSYSLLDKNNQSALHYAGAYNKPELFKFLLDNNFELYLKDKNGITPRDFAFRNFSIFTLCKLYNFFNQEDKETIKATVVKIGSSMNTELIILK